MSWIKVVISSITGNLKLWLGALGVGVLAIAVAMIRKSGADAEKLKQAQADAKAARTIEENRTKSKGMSDDELDEELSKWTRK